MKRHASMHRWMFAALTVAALSLALGTTAQADPGSRRWKGDHGRWGHGAPQSRVVYRVVERGHDGPGPVLAGLIGGFVLGSAFSHPQPVVVHERVVAPAPPRYRYEDGDGSRWWDTLDEAREAAFDVHGPRVVRVIDNRTDECVRTLYWKHDHFISDDDNWDGE